MKFPRTVFKDGGNLDRAGGKYSDLLVQNEDEYISALDAGWYASLPEAIDPPKKIEKEAEPAHEVEDLEPPDEPLPVETAPEVAPELEDAPPTREEMEIKARELGIKFDGRIGDKKLLALIEKALEA